MANATDTAAMVSETLRQRFNGSTYTFNYDGMEDIVYEALAMAFYLGEIHRGEHLDALFGALTQKVRNYALTGYANGRR